MSALKGTTQREKMTGTICLIFVVVALLFPIVVPGYADGRGHDSVWIGPGRGPWWWRTPAYPYPPYYWQPHVITQEQPPVYVQLTPEPEDKYYWYFCPDSKKILSVRKNCPSGWLRVAPP
jgi:hypothetical protein